MPSAVLKINRLFAMEWGKLMAYRFDIIAWTLAESSIPLVSLAIWYAVSVQSSAGPTPRETLTYYVLVIFVKILTDAWNGWFMAWEILNGNIVQHLLRPYPVIIKDVVNNLVEKSIKLIIPLPIMFILLIFSSVFSPQVYQINNWLLFIPSLVLAMILAFVLEAAFGFVAFWLEEAHQIRAFKNIFETVASGILIPFVLMPPAARFILSFLPFRYIVSAPAEILLEQVTFNEAVRLIAIQVGWIFGLIFLARFMWQVGLKRYAIPGQ